MQAVRAIGLLFTVLSLGLHPEWARILVGGLGALFFIGGGLLLLAIRWRGGSRPTTDPGRLSP